MLNWSATVATAHGQAVRAPVDTVSAQQTPTFPSQQLDRSHQVAESDALMNGYGPAPQHTQYPDPQSSLAHATQPDTSGLTSLSALAGDHQQHHQHAQHAQHAQQHHQAQHQQQQRAGSKQSERLLYQHQYAAAHPGSNSSPTSVAHPSSAAAGYNIPAWSVPEPTPAQQPQPQQPSAPSSSSMPPPSPALGGPSGLAPPPEGIYRTFDDLLQSVQRTAKEQGYSIVKLRASNYRDGKPTRYDLVCDRGGVKYSSTAKKRTPSTRKVDCPWRAKAVCEVNLGNQWRFAVQEARHNHEARVPAAVPGQENTPVAQSLRSITNKVDRISHDMAQGFARLEGMINSRLEGIEKRLDAIENARMLGANGVLQPQANMVGGGGLTNGGMPPLVDGRLGNMETRLSQMEPRSLDGLQMMDDESNRLGMMVPS
ncbi:hypothetical protein N0V88_005756 [Collariella sp. IMI 366227]|nr:hypothetical protein N0V88_005756 [Collariella sp. IMI 366227]